MADLFKSKSEFYDHEHEITNNISKRASERTKKPSQKRMINWQMQFKWVDKWNQNFFILFVFLCVFVLLSMAVAIKTIRLLMRITTNMNVIFLWFISAMLRLFFFSVHYVNLSGDTRLKREQGKQTVELYKETKRDIWKHHLRFSRQHHCFDIFSSWKICVNGRTLHFYNDSIVVLFILSIRNQQRIRLCGRCKRILWIINNLWLLTLFECQQH